jgi:TfoX/Sxy family transcriptional regulator of competence genes
MTRKPSFSIKQVKRGGARYIRLYANERKVAHLKVDERVKEKIRRKVAEHLVYQEEVEKVVEKLYREILMETSKDLKTL